MYVFGQGVQAILVGINLLSKPNLKIGWGHILQYKCTYSGVEFTRKTVQLGCSSLY